jgi:hypothetical protein
MNDRAFSPKGNTAACSLPKLTAKFSEPAPSLAAPAGSLIFSSWYARRLPQVETA